MGRLDSAMRRAAKDQADAAGVGALDPRDAVSDIFPSEDTLPTARASSVFTPAEPVQAVAPRGPVAAAAPAVPAAQADEKGPSLLQMVDVRLARKTVVDAAMLPASREQYRRLAAALHQAQRANGFKVAMVASAVAGEGKTLTAANLALTLSESYRRNVLLVDGDLRRPSLHTVFQVEGTPGLSDGLISKEEPKLPLHRLSARLTILPAGRPTSDPMGALTSDRMRRLLEEAREVFDWVIIDTPPVGLLTDAALLSSMADGVVLVVKAESTQYDLVNRAVDIIGRERVIGVVLNRASEEPHRSTYDYSNYYYGAPELPAGRG